MVATETPSVDIGWQALDFDLPGIDGKQYRLSEIKGSAGTVVMFICNHCPYVQAIADRIARDCEELRSYDIASIAVMPNDTDAYSADSLPHMKEFAAKYNFGFPYVVDETQAVARAYDAVCTPDFFGFNGDLQLQYRGRLDSSRNQPAAPDARRELFEAMLEIGRAGKGPAQQSASIGCSIKWRAAA
jgi:peroxiredoxin